MFLLCPHGSSLWPSPTSWAAFPPIFFLQGLIQNSSHPNPSAKDQTEARWAGWPTPGPAESTSAASICAQVRPRRQLMDPPLPFRSLSWHPVNTRISLRSHFLMLLYYCFALNSLYFFLNHFMQSDQIPTLTGSHIHTFPEHKPHCRLEPFTFIYFQGFLPRHLHCALCPPPCCF